MATPGCDRGSLLLEFQDNDTQAITAASMRLFVNCTYDNFQEISNIVDNLITTDPYTSLSANQGVVLNDKIESLDTRLQNVETNKADSSSVYTKIESDNLYYNKTYIDTNYYTQSELYTKQEIDTLISSIQQQFDAITARIDNIVQKNGLIE